MNFDEHVGLGAVIDIVVLVAGLIGGWVTMKFSLKATIEKLTDLKMGVDEDRKRGGQQHEQNVSEISSIKLQIEKECLKKDDFREFEGRFNQKVKDIEHAANGAAMKAAELIARMLPVGGMRRGERE